MTNWLGFGIAVVAAFSAGLGVRAGWHIVRHLRVVSIVPSVEQPNPERATKDAEIAAQDFTQITNRLAHSIRRERVLALIAVTAALGAGVTSLLLLYNLAHSGLTTIHKAAASKHPSELPAVTIYLLVRGTAYAALVSGMVFAIINLARSALDQATRFDKRLIAAHFIDFAVHSPDVDTAKMETALRVLEAWGASVESAYTPPRVAKRRAPEALAVGMDKSGVHLNYTAPDHS
jgi:hypothetical protein